MMKNLLDALYYIVKSEKKLIAEIAPCIKKRELFEIHKQIAKTCLHLLKEKLLQWAAGHVRQRL